MKNPQDVRAHLRIFLMNGADLVNSNFVVKTIFHACGSSEVLTENYFATRKEAEEFCALTDYAMKLNYGAEQQLVTTEIVAL